MCQSAHSASAIHDKLDMDWIPLIKVLFFISFSPPAFLLWSFLPILLVSMCTFVAWWHILVGTVMLATITGSYPSPARKQHKRYLQVFTYFINNKVFTIVEIRYQNLRMILGPVQMNSRRSFTTVLIWLTYIMCTMVYTASLSSPSPPSCLRLSSIWHATLSSELSRILL